MYNTLNYTMFFGSAFIESELQYELLLTIELLSYSVVTGKDFWSSVSRFVVLFIHVCVYLCTVCLRINPLIVRLTFTLRCRKSSQKTSRLRL